MVDNNNKNKFSIITPTYNSQRFIRETIESVINQKGEFSIEYTIIDNCSTDQTRQIVEEYIDLLESDKFPIKCNGVYIKFISGRDSSMYEAIKNGFDQATGNIYAWINSDDIYLPGAFDVIKRTFSKYQQVQWLKGITSYINENSNIFATGLCNFYQQNWIIQGVYGPVMHFIQQDSVFWRPALWDKSGGIDSNYKAAGDYALWRKFAQHEPLYSINALVSCFRKVSGQKSADIKSYWQEVNDYERIKDKYRLIRKYFSFESRIPRYLRPLCLRFISGNNPYHLITLENNMDPCHRKGSYYEMKKML